MLYYIVYYYDNTESKHNVNDERSFDLEMVSLLSYIFNIINGIIHVIS